MAGGYFFIIFAGAIRTSASLEMRPSGGGWIRNVLEIFVTPAYGYGEINGVISGSVTFVDLRDPMTPGGRKHFVSMSTFQRLKLNLHYPSI